MVWNVETLNVTRLKDNVQLQKNGLALCSPKQDQELKTVHGII